MATSPRNRRLLIGGAIAAGALFFATFTAFAVFGLRAVGDFELDRPELGIGLAAALGLAFVVKLVVFVVVARAALRFFRDRAGRGPGQWYGSFGWNPASGGTAVERRFGPGVPPSTSQDPNAG